MVNGAIGSKLMNRLFKMGDPLGGDNEFIQFPAIPTKYTVYNVYSGTMVEGVNGMPVLNGGLFARLCNIIGESGCGKTSILIGKVTSSVDYIWNRFGPGYSEIFYCDPENNTPPNRFMSLARWSPADFMNKCNYSNKPISLVELANMILKIYNIKTTCKKDYLLPSGLRDVDGREIMFLAPTYICIDSVAQVNPNGVEDLLQLDKAGEVKDNDKLGSNMEAALDAKAWTIFVRKIKPYLDGANIGLYCINHKTKEMKVGMFDKETRYLPFLGMGEKIKGGKEFIYQSFNIFDLSSGEKLNDRNPIYGPDINGFVANASFVKNKYNIEGAKFPMVFDMSRGYMPELSDMEYLWQKKFGIQGSVKLALDVLPEVQFTRRTLLETIEEYPQLARALAFTAKYRSTQEMIYGNKNILPLTDLGTNVPLEQRLAMIYAYTESYSPKDDVGEMYTNFSQLANENKHYFCFNLHDGYYNNNIISEPNVKVISSGYTPIIGKGVTPFDNDVGKAIGSKYVIANEYVTA